VFTFMTLIKCMALRLDKDHSATLTNIDDHNDKFAMMQQSVWIIHGPVGMHSAWMQTDVCN